MARKAIKQRKQRKPARPKGTVPRNLLPQIWKPGQSGNPKGRTAVMKPFQELCREFRPEMAQNLLDMARSPKHTTVKLRATELMLAYDIGRPLQTHVVRVIRTFDDLSNEELAALAGLDSDVIEGEAEEGEGSE